jgi:CBS-domain-containing membrane protein
MVFESKSRTNAVTLPTRPSMLAILVAWLASSLAIACVAYLGQVSDQPLILGSFGASCVLLFGFPDAVFSQPRNLIGGHVLCSLIGLGFLKVLGSDWWFMALAVGTALAVMLATRTVHPPAGSNPVIIFLTQPDWQFLWFPTLSGGLVLLCLSRIYLKIARKAH